MNKTLLIIQREYLSRVKKRSFLIATFLVPLLFVGVYGIAIYAFISSDEIKKVQVLDESGLFLNKFSEEKSNNYVFEKKPLEEAKMKFKDSGFDALVFIPKNIVEKPEGLMMFAEKTVNAALKSNVENIVQGEVRNLKLKKLGIDVKIIDDNKVNVSANTYSLNDNSGKEKSSSTGAAAAIGGIIGFLLYFTIIISGSQVMSGVIEEKSSRIIEVMISSVKPIQLMIGKIVGIGLVSLTQFILWMLLFGILTGVAGSIIASKTQDKIQKQVTVGMSKDQVKMIESQVKAENPMNQLDKVTESMSIPKLIFCFFFFYLGGYLLYSSLYAAVGSSVETIQEAQQFSLPITLPIIVSFMLAQGVIKDPDSSLAFWASIIPFSSPINMMMRLPFGVPTWELVLSMVLLILGFLFTTWLASRIYRIGILMNGKKPSWKEISKWVFYKG
jgi:ABC-2 type transport system permease protein